MKNITELTEDEAEEILKFVYPNKWTGFQGISHKPVIDEEGRQQITFCGKPIIGIKYLGEQDGYVLPFNNHKVVLWLYKHGYNIESLLEENKHTDELLADYWELSDLVYRLSNGEKSFAESAKQNYTLEYVERTCKEALDEFYNKEYEQKYD